MKCSYRRASSDSVPQGAVDCEPHQAEISRMGLFSSTGSAEHSQQHTWFQVVSPPLDQVQDAQLLRECLCNESLLI